MSRLQRVIAVVAVLLVGLVCTVLVILWGFLALTPLPAADLPAATEVVDRAGHVISRYFVQNRTEVSFQQLPQHLRDAFIAVEDERFFQHRGIDPRALSRAAWHNLVSRRVVEGGSTITQQLAKNLYLGNERTIGRKLKEAVFALKLEAAYSKGEILLRYLNTIYLGEGSFGVQAASQTFFGKDVADLTLAEAALVAGLARGPELFNPFSDLTQAVARRNVVLDQMAAGGWITPASAAAARQETVRLAPRNAGTRAPFFVDYVATLIQARFPALAADLRQGGYRIETTLDLGMQTAAEQALADELSAGAADAKGIMQPQAALVALDPDTGEIRAMVGGRDYGSSPFNRAVNARRQPGSAFKPFLYAAVMNSWRFTAASTQMCAPVAFPTGSGRPPYVPKDFEPEHPYHNRLLTVREAIAVSDNVVAVKWMDTIGPEAVVDLARGMGITSPLRANLPLALGSSEVTVLEMAAAFTPFANGGFSAEPLAIRRILDGRGRVVADFTPTRHRALDDRIAFVMTDILRDVLKPGGTAGQVAGLIGGRPAAGKTGTSDNSRDGWLVAFTPDLLAAVWTGNDDNQTPLPAGHTGATLAAPIWANFVRRALAEAPPREFRRPPDIVSVPICTASGLAADGECPSRFELFISGTEPVAPARDTAPWRWPDATLPTEPTPTPRRPSPPTAVPQLPPKRPLPSPFRPRGPAFPTVGLLPNQPPD